MAVRTIITFPDPRLRLISEPITVFDESVQKLCEDLLDTSTAAPARGLAAIQIAVPKRALVIDIPQEDSSVVFPLFVLNPEILWRSEETHYLLQEEGCLSVLDCFVPVPRHKKIHLRFQNPQGEKQELKAEGILATVLQHEIEHLEGRLILDYLSKFKMDRYVQRLQKRSKKKLNEDGYPD